jgi:hypothetical protein
MRSRTGAPLLLAALLALGCQGRTHGAAAKDSGNKELATAAAEPAGASQATVSLPQEPSTPEVAPAAAAEPPAPLWRVRDNGVRCVRAPCPTLDALPVDSAADSVRVVEVDLSALGLSPKDTQRLVAMVHEAGLLVRGQVEQRTDVRGKPYTVLRATALPSR